MWNLLHQGNIQGLHHAITEAQQRKTGWHPSADLLHALENHETDQLLDLNQKASNWQNTLELFHKNPSRFDCKHAYRRLYVNQSMLELHQQQDAQALYLDTLSHCNDNDRLAALQHAEGRIGAESMYPLLQAIEQRPLASTLQTAADLVAFHYWNQQYWKSKSLIAYSHVDRLFSRLKGQQKSDIAEAMGWIELDTQHPNLALENFRAARMMDDTDNSLKGEVVALHATEQITAMKQLMTEQQLRLDRMGALPDLLPLLAAGCGKHGDDQCQLETLHKIEAFRSLFPEEEESRAWIYYRQQKFSQAADTFESIYRQKQLEGTAKGLFVSLMRLGQTNRATRLADELGGSFQDILNHGDAERFYMRKLFHAAQAYDDEFDPALKHLDADYARLSFMQRRRGGNTLEPIFNQLLQRKLVIEGGTFKDRKHHFSVRYEPTQLDVGKPILVLGDNFGTNPIVPTPAAFPIQTYYTGYEWDLAYRYEDWRSWYADIGQGFVHGRLKAALKGHIGVKQEYLTGFVQGELFRQPIRESLLSYAGMNDPFTNKSWGRVMRSGGQLNGYTLSGIPDVGLTYLLRAEWMRGVSVQNNRHLLVNVFIPRHFQWFRDTEWSVGPLYQWESFANDQGHFMWGHGGYFSPQTNNYFGLNMRFVSRESRLYNYEFRAFFGQQSYSTKTTPLLPFTPDGRMFLAQSIHEKMYQIQGKIVRDLPWNLQIGGSFAWSDAIYKAPLPVNFNNYRELLMSVFLTWQPEDRKETMSSDHPLFGIGTLY